MSITIPLIITSLFLVIFSNECFAAPQQGQLQLFLPPSLSTCMPIQIQWNNAIGPKINITVFTLNNQSIINSQPERNFINLDADKGSQIWRIDLPSKQNVILRLVDSAGRLIDSPPTAIVRSVASEPPCSIEGQSVAQSVFQQMSFNGPIGVEPPRLITTLPTQQKPAKIINGTVIAQFNTPMFLNSSSAVPVVPVIMPKIGKINDSASVLVINPNGSSIGILLPAQPAHNSAFQISVNFFIFWSNLILVMLFVFDM